MNLIGAKTEWSSLLKDAESWIERVRMRMCPNYLLAELFYVTPCSRERNGLKLSNAVSFLCRKPGIEINTTFVYFSNLYVESGLADLEKLETPVWVYSVNVTSNGCYHDTIAGIATKFF